jgi:hypothetical protein
MITSIVCENSFVFLVKKDEKFENSLPTCCVAAAVEMAVVAEEEGSPLRVAKHNK